MSEQLKAVCEGGAEVDALTTSTSGLTMAQVEELQLVSTIQTALKATGKPGAIKREGACKAFGAVAKNLESNRALEPATSELLPDIINACGDKFRPVQLAAAAALKEYGAVCHRDAVPSLVSKCIVSNQKWQANVARIELLQAFNKRGMCAFCFFFLFVLAVHTI